jgi:hypothetical protein
MIEVVELLDYAEQGKIVYALFVNTIELQKFDALQRQVWAECSKTSTQLRSSIG